MPSEKPYSEIKKMLEGKGYTFDRCKGSHHNFIKAGCRTVVIPVHHGKVKPGYVRMVQKLEE